MNLDQKERYHNQLSLPGMTEERQSKLLNSKVCILGLSAVASTCALNLCQAGLGEIILVDESVILPSDLATHCLFYPEDIGLPKVDVLKQRLENLNSDTKIKNHFIKFDTHNAEILLKEADIVAEALENWQDKLLLSDTCMKLEKPLIHSGMISFSFHVFSMIPKRSACLRCVFAKLGLEDFPPRGTDQAILGAIASLTGAFQAAELIKIVTQIGTVSGNHLLRFDVLRSEFDDMTELIGRADCPDCGRWG